MSKPTGQELVDKASECKGDRYIFGVEVDLNNPNPTAEDCSELVEWACYQLGVYPKVPDGSWNQREHCLEISVEDAATTPGALLFHPGHVAISTGDGKHTIEAMGRKYGVLNGNIGDRFDSGGLIPGVDYGSNWEDV